MANLFGNTNALIGSLDLLFGAIYFLGAVIFRKSIANDNLNVGFSMIGSTAAGCITFLIIKALTDWSIKFPFVIGLIAWVIGGLLLSDIIGDGWSDGSGGGE